MEYTNILQMLKMPCYFSGLNCGLSIAPWKAIQVMQVCRCSEFILWCCSAELQFLCTSVCLTSYALEYIEAAAATFDHETKLL
jgi:hypothetical protein